MTASLAIQQRLMTFDMSGGIIDIVKSPTLYAEASLAHAYPIEQMDKVEVRVRLKGIFSHTSFLSLTFAWSGLSKDIGVKLEVDFSRSSEPLCR